MGDTDAGPRLAAWREVRGLSLRELARKANNKITHSAISQIESGGSARHETLVALLEALDLTFAQFWGPLPAKPKAARGAKAS